MGVDGFLICSKSDGIYRWKNMDGKIIRQREIHRPEKLPCKIALKNRPAKIALQNSPEK